MQFLEKFKHEFAITVGLFHTFTVVPCYLRVICGAERNPVNNVGRLFFIILNES